MYGTKLGETSKKERAKGKARSQTLTTSRSLTKEAKEKEKEKKGKAKEKANKPKEKEKLSLPSLQPTKARGNSSFQKESNGATYAGRKGIAPKLAGGTPTSSSNSSTNKSKLGTIQANNSNGLPNSSCSR